MPTTLFVTMDLREYGALLIAADDKTSKDLSVYTEIFPQYGVIVLQKFGLAQMINCVVKYTFIPV